MTKDEYGKHTISNIYFDTGNFELIRHSIEKPVYKEKLRLRAYGQVTEKSRVFVELKKKYDGIVYKRRAELSLPMGNRSLNKRELKITIPEHLDYSGIFEDIFSSYTRSAELKCVKTVNMGSLYELHYGVDLKSEEKEKQMLDAIRCRNGNLPIVCGQKPDAREEL